MASRYGHSKNVSSNIKSIENLYSVVKKIWIVNINKNDATITSPFSIH